MPKFHLVEENYVAWHSPGCEGGHAVPVQGFYPDQPERGWGWNKSLDEPTLTPSVLVHPHDASTAIQAATALSLFYSRRED